MQEANTEANTEANNAKKTRLERIEQRIAHLQRQRQAITARQSEKNRKARTRRLIQIGAIAVKYLNCSEEIEPAEFEKKISELVRSIQ